LFGNQTREENERKKKEMKRSETQSMEVGGEKNEEGFGACARENKVFV
jgi:hypothetical protein